MSIFACITREAPTVGFTDEKDKHRSYHRVPHWRETLRGSVAARGRSLVYTRVVTLALPLDPLAHATRRPRTGRLAMGGHAAF